MKWIKDIIEGRQVAAKAKQERRIAEEAYYKEAGMTIAKFAEHQAFVYLKDRNIDTDSPSAQALQKMLVRYANDRMFQFLSGEKVGRKIALGAHYNTYEVTDAGLQQHVEILQEKLQVVDATRFSDEQARTDFIQGFGKRVEGVIEQLVYNAAAFEKPDYHAMGM